MAGNPWLIHVKKVWAKQKGKMSYSQVLKHAKLSYKKVGAKTKKKRSKK